MNLERLKQIELALLLGITPRTLTTFDAKGMPKHGTGRSIWYVWAEARDWWVRHQVDKALDRGGASAPTLGANINRKERALADIREMELAKMRAELLPAEDVRKAIFDGTRKARDMILGAPDRIAPLVVGLTDSHEIHTILSEEMRRVCSDLAKMNEPKGGNGRR